MKTRLAMIVIVSSILVISIYSSSTNYVSAKESLKNNNLLTKDNEIATDDSQVTTNEGSNDNNSIAENRHQSFNIQDLLSRYFQSEDGNNTNKKTLK
jgi:hypothetical protein